MLNMTSTAAVCLLMSASVVTSNLITLSEFSWCYCKLESFEFNSVCYFSQIFIFNIISYYLTLSALCTWLFVKETVDK